MDKKGPLGKGDDRALAVSNIIQYKGSILNLFDLSVSCFILNCSKRFY